MLAIQQKSLGDSFLHDMYISVFDNACSLCRLLSCDGSRCACIVVCFIISVHRCVYSGQFLVARRLCQRGFQLWPCLFACVCHKSVYCRTGWKDRAGFLGRFDLILTVGWKSSEMPVCAGNLDSHMVPWAHPRTCIYPKRHVSWFIRFCRAHGRDQQTDTQTTSPPHRQRSVKTSAGSQPHLLLCTRCGLTTSKYSIEPFSLRYHHHHHPFYFRQQGP